jgi:hypothetical protein
MVAGGGAKQLPARKSAGLRRSAKYGDDVMITVFCDFHQFLQEMAFFLKIYVMISRI